MLSVVPLINGGGLFETGAGGSAPKHVQQLVKENYLRWDSLGEFLALAVSFEHLADVTGNARAQVLGATPSTARPGPCSTRTRAPPARSAASTTAAATSTSRSTGPQELAKQTEDADLADDVRAGGAGARRTTIATISEELLAAQGHPADIGGYYRPDPAKVAAVMRPSTTFNEIIDALA